MSKICTSINSLSGVENCTAPTAQPPYSSTASYYIFTPIKCLSDGILHRMGNVGGIRWVIGNIGLNVGYGYNGLYIIPDTYSSCEGFNATRLADYRSRCTTLTLVIQSFNFVEMRSIWENPLAFNSFVTDTVNFVVTNNFDEVEFDWEGWYPGGDSTPTDWANFKLLLTAVGNALHTANKKLVVAIPPIRNITAQGFYTNFVYAELNSLPVDYYMLMAYDYMYGADTSISVSPDLAMVDTLNFLKSNVPNNQIIGGIANYGYRTPDNISPITVEALYREDINALIPTEVRYAVRADDSSELSLQRGGYWYKFPDETTISRRRRLYEASGIMKIAVWSLNTNTSFI